MTSIRTKLHRVTAAPPRDAAAPTDLDRGALLAELARADAAARPAPQTATPAPAAVGPATPAPAAPRPRSTTRPAAATATSSPTQSAPPPSRAPDEPLAPDPARHPAGSVRDRLARLHAVPSHVGPRSSFAANTANRAAPTGHRSASQGPTPTEQRSAPPHAPHDAGHDAPPRAGAALGRSLARAFGSRMVIERQCAVFTEVVPLTFRLGDALLQEGVSADLPGNPKYAGLGLGVDQPLDDMVFFDIESTGLSASEHHAFIFGVARFVPNGVLVEQIVPLGAPAEPDSIELLRARVADRRGVVTFNGAKFDLPFLGARAQRHGASNPLGEHAHIDLYRVAREAFRGLGGRFSLKALEERLLGFARHDDLPGREAPAAWLRLLSTGDSGPFGRVLEHNRLDLLAMIPLALRIADELPAPAGAAPAPPRDRRADERQRARQRREAVLDQVKGNPVQPIVPVRDQFEGDELFATAMVELGAGRAADAASMLARALELGIAVGARRRALRELGRWHVRAGDVGAGVAYLEQLVASPPADGEAHELLAEAYEGRLLELDRALFHARRAATLMPWSGAARERVGRLSQHS